MGEQRRYATALERRSLERLNREIMAQGPPDGLREWEVELDRLALTTPPAPVAVTAFVVYKGGHMRVPAFATRWTEQAVDVTWAITDDPDGPRHRAWVWRGAVRSRQ